jgi:hypothetical protein
MKILVGNDWKSSAAGYAGAASNISLLLTGFLSVVAMQVPRFSWVWAILSAGVVCAIGIYRAIIGVITNNLQGDPNIGTLETPAVVNVTTTGPTPAATPATSIK